MVSVAPAAITMMMKTESFNWQRPAKICNGVKDFGLLREKLTNVAGDADADTDLGKRRGFSSMYVSRAVFIVGVIAVITFVICLVLADKYQKSVNSTHHYASFVYEKSRDERQHYGRNAGEDGDTGDSRDENGRVGQGVFNAPGFIKLQNISHRLPIEEINLLVPVTTVLRSLNVSRNGRQYSPSAGGDILKKMPHAIVVSAAKNVSQQQQSTTTATATTAGAKKHRGIQSLADLLRRTELKAVATRPSGDSDSVTANASGTSTNGANASTSTSASTNKPIATIDDTSTSTSTVATSTQQTSIHFAQLESYPHRTQPHNNNLQHLIEYINCESSSDDCWLKRQRHQNANATATAAADHHHYYHRLPIQKPEPATFDATQQPGHDREYFEQLDVDLDSNGNGDGDDDSYAPRNHYEDDAKGRVQTAEQHQYLNDVSPLSTTDNGDGDGGRTVYGYGYEYGNGNDDDGHDNGNGNGDGDDTMFTADTQAAPSYYSASVAAATATAPYLALHRNRVDSDLFRNFRASSPVEINRLQLHDQTESAASASMAEHTLQHRFSNRMYHSRGGGGDNMEAYTLDLDPYLKPPTPPPPTMLSFTPSYSTNGFHAFNDPLSMGSASASASGPLPSAFSDDDLRSEATAVQSLVSQVKPISLMVEIFPANEYELPDSVLGGRSGSNSDNRAATFTAQQGDQTYSNQANVASLMSWKLTPFSQNKMRLLVNLFPQHRAPATGKHSPLSGTT